MTQTPDICFSTWNLTPGSNEFLSDWASSNAWQWPLNEQGLAEHGRYCGFPAELNDAILTVWQDLCTDPQLERIARHLAYALSLDDHALYAFPTDRDDLSPLLTIPILLQAIPSMQQRYVDRGIPDRYCQDTLADVCIWIEDYRSKNGVWGFDKLDWLQHHIRLRLVRLGRLQFEPMTFKDPVCIFRKGQDVHIACTAGQQVCTDGLFASCKTTAMPAFTTEWQEDEQAWQAHFVNERGAVVQEQMQRLSRHEWQIAVQANDDVLSVHIPAAGPMTIAACADSFAQAQPFFEQYFPELNLKAFYCSSWLLSPYFADYLKPSSNMVQFMQSWHTFARPGTDDHEFFVRVWGTQDVDLTTAPQNSSLQRAIIAHIQSGGVWNDMGGIRLLDELPFAPLA